MIVEPKVKGFLCITAHPEGCAENVREQIAYVKGKGEIKGGCKSALIIGSSTGYGLASRITAAFGCGAATVGVFFERPGDAARSRPASAGWYNTAEFAKQAEAAGLYCANINGDAFGDEVKKQAIEAIKKSPLGKVDLIVYSLASPRRTDPDTGEVYKSVLKTVGEERKDKSLDTDKGQVIEVTVPAATEREIFETVKTMGGDDWERWIKALDGAGRLSRGLRERRVLLHRARAHLSDLPQRHHRARKKRSRSRRGQDRRAAETAARQGVHIRKQGARHAGEQRDSRRAPLRIHSLQGDEGKGNPRGLHRANPASFLHPALQRQLPRI